MSEYELNYLKELFIKLKEIVNEYGGDLYKLQLGILKDIVECIDSEWNIKEKEVYVIRNYKNLYPKQGGLSDFYIYHDNYGERLKLNKPLDEVNHALWELMKKYL